MAGELDGITSVIMAKRPAPGHVKSRLVRAGFVDEAGAAVIAGAMLECTVARLRAAGEVVLALAPGAPATGETPPALAAALAAVDDAALRAVEQGTGDLGARIDRVWRAVGSDRPVAFFGGDSPDLPLAALAAIRPALADATLALGPTDDGGYWTLAARTHVPEVLRGIDWGGESVYDQTRRRASDAGASVHVLPAWRDVDRPEDVVALRERLAARAGAPASPADAALDRLGARLDELLGAQGSTE